MLKKILVVLAGLVALILIIPVFLPSSFKVVRTIEIAKPAETVFRHLADYQNWNAWSPWYQMDPKAKQTFSGKAGEVGHKETWDGEILGAGYQVVEEIIPNQLLKSKLVFTKPDPMESTATFKLEPIPTGVKIIWSNEGKLDYPVGRYFGPFLDKMLGKDFEDGLSNLKKLAEK